YVQDVRYAACAWMHRTPARMLVVENVWNRFSSGAYMDVVYVPRGQEPKGTRIRLCMSKNTSQHGCAGYQMPYSGCRLLISSLMFTFYLVSYAVHVNSI